MLVLERLEAPCGSVLVRIVVDDPRTWPATLPVVPAGHTVTLTAGDVELLDVPPDAVLTRGYRLIGVSPGSPGDTVDVLVPGDLRIGQPAWWAEVVLRADRIFDLDMGPVRRVLGGAIALHLADA